MKRFAVIIPAAGSGRRSGKDVPKQYVEIAGVPVLEHTIAAFLDCEECIEVVIAVDDAWRDTAARCGRGDIRVRIVSGGAERQHSVANALAALTSDATIVLVHDAARPCVHRALIHRAVDAADHHGAALPVIPLSDTVKRVDAEGRVVATVSREYLRLAQTPQAFRRELLVRAYARAADEGTLATDDAGLVESLGESVVTIAGDPDNIKITVATDFERALTTLMRRASTTPRSPSA